MEAPVRATVAQKMVESYAESSKNKGVSSASGAPLVNDLIQFSFVEIEPQVNRSSRSAHFISSGYKEYREGNYFNAANVFTKAIDDNGKNWLAYFWRGITFDKVGGFVRALRDFTSAIKCRTRQAVEELGDTTGQNKNVDDPAELAAIYFNRGVVYCHVGDDNSAYEDFTSAIKRDSANHM
jgi:tetratricopeptide (TPR) repeat protein